MNINPASPAGALVVAALRNAITDQLPQLSEVQMDSLCHIHDSAPWQGLWNCPPDKLAETYDLVFRTIAQNKLRVRVVKS